MSNKRGKERRRLTPIHLAERIATEDWECRASARRRGDDHRIKPRREGAADLLNVLLQRGDVSLHRLDVLGTERGKFIGDQLYELRF